MTVPAPDFAAMADDDFWGAASEFATFCDARHPHFGLWMAEVERRKAIALEKAKSDLRYLTADYVDLATEVA